MQAPVAATRASSESKTAFFSRRAGLEKNPSTAFITALICWQPDGTPVTITEAADLPILGNGPLWQPADGWPAVSANASISIDVTREYDASVNPAIRRLALDLVKQSCDGLEIGPLGGVRTFLEAIPREPARRLKYWKGAALTCRTERRHGAGSR